MAEVPDQKEPNEAPGASALDLTFRLFAMIREHRLVFLFAFIAIFLASFAEVAPAGLAKTAAAVLFEGTDEASAAESKSAAQADWLIQLTQRFQTWRGQEDADPKDAAIPMLVVALLLLGLLAGAAHFASQYYGRMLSAHVVVSLRCALMRKTLEMPVSWLSARKTGDLVSRFATDVDATYVGLSAFVLRMVQRAVILVFAVLAAFLFNWRLALASLFVLPLLVFPVVWIGRKSRKHSRKSLITLGEGTEALTQSLSGKRVIKAFGAEAEAEAKYRDLNEGWLERQRKLNRALASSQGLMQMVFAISLAIVVGLGGTLVIQGRWNLDHASFVGFLAALGMIYSPLKMITKTYQTWQVSMAAAARVFDVLDAKVPRVSTGTKTVAPLQKAIELKKVRFSYRDEEGVVSPVLNDVSFTLHAGETVALVGPSGSGKSTIADLIFGFLAPDEGSISYDGVPMSEIDSQSLLRQVSIVAQQPFLFRASIRENILYGRPEADHAAIEAAAKAAQIHDRIVDLPEGYDTVLGDRGANLSGGELQRVTIARALLKNASVMLLDEATSNLDPLAERAVQSALKERLQGGTVLVIAHRLSTLVDVDRIVVLEKGRVVEEGRHAELIKKNGAFAKLSRAQQESAAS